MKPQALLLIAAVVLAGCVGQPSSVTSTNGVIIKSFGANPPEIESRTSESLGGISTIVTVVIQNVGGTAAEWVTVQLTGLSNEWELDQENTAESKCTHDSELIERQLLQEVREIEDKAQLHIPTTLDLCRYYIVGKLFPPDPERGLQEGQETVAEWALMPPVRKEVEQTYEVGTRVSYHYKTVFDSIIRIVSSEYYQQTGNQGGIITSTVSGGPLIASLKAPSYVLTQGGEKLIPIQIEVQNVGSGRVFHWSDADAEDELITREPSIDDWDFADVTIKLDNNDITKNSPLHNCKLIGIEDGQHVKLINGKSGRISCKLAITDKVESFIDKAITFEFTYNYVTDSTTTIRVLPIVR